MMSNNIFEEANYDMFEHSPNNQLLSGLYVGKEAVMDMDMDMDSFDCGVSFFQQYQYQYACTSKNHDDHDQDLFLDHDDHDYILSSSSSKKAADPLSSSSSSSFELLNKYGGRCRRLKGETMRPPPNMTRGMSIDTIIRLAAHNFITSHPYPTSVLLYSTHSESSVRLIHNLLSCADKVHKRRYDQARQLLLHNNITTSPHGTTVQRLVFYFTQALHHKIDRQTGGGQNNNNNNSIQVIKRADPNMMMAFHKQLPISQITKFAGIQAIIDHIPADATKLHLIDLEIRTGIHIIVLMQALISASCITTHLKITAVATTSSSRQGIDDTGRRLQSFAASLALNVSFHVITVEDVLDHQIQIDEEEAVAVYAEYTLTHMIGQPTRLEQLMRVLRGFKNVCVMVVAEVEADLNSPVFVDRFVEALVFYGAFFELMAESLGNDHDNSSSSRYIAESTCFSSSIMNMVGCEGDERKIRHVRMRVWRAFFERFGFRETELSMSSVYQAASLLPKNFASGNSFTFDEDGKSLIIGWKGTPLTSLSAWN